jgi:hypothetical protein
MEADTGRYVNIRVNIGDPGGQTMGTGTGLRTQYWTQDTAVYPGDSSKTSTQLWTQTQTDPKK